MRITRIRRNSRAFDITLIVIFLILALITVYPFYNVLIVSLSNTMAVARHMPYLLPFVFDLTGYKTILGDPMFARALWVSVMVTVVGTSINMFLSVTGAYVLSKKDLIGRNVLLTLILFSMLFSGGLVPTYLVIKSLGLVNSVWAMIVPTAINSFYLIIMKNYFLTIPSSLLEAAKLDGANEWTLLCRIVLPVSKPFIATFTLFYCVERWNEWYNALLYINKQSISPLQIYLRQILVNLNSQLSAQAQQMINSTQKVSASSVQMAAIIITALPIICVYPFLQKYFVKGIMVGGIKE